MDSQPKKQKTLIDKGWDTLETIANALGYGQSIVAKGTAELLGANPQKGVWGYDWTDAYLDIKKKSAKDLTLGEKGLLLGANIILDPANLIGGAGAVRKAQKGIDLIQTASKVEDSGKSY